MSDLYFNVVLTVLELLSIRQVVIPLSKYEMLVRS